MEIYSKWKELTDYLDYLESLLERKDKKGNGIYIHLTRISKEYDLNPKFVKQYLIERGWNKWKKSKYCKICYKKKGR